MSDTLSGDDVTILYSTDGTLYTELSGVVDYAFGLNCTTKDYQPAGSEYIYTAKLSKKADLTLSLLDHTDLDIPDPCYLQIALFFDPNLIWVRQGVFRHLNVSHGKTADGIATRSIEFSAIGSVTNYVTTELNLTGEFDWTWETIIYQPPSTYEWTWETIVYSLP